ncbi:hypothetical protein [Campylobacter lanienae]|uniref:hypothetical protein n=1 Tax=Campylobacter lanienae TaxID=75658 RepID=UPI000BB43E9A|nr:hypothetical protein [Campylobacter lanienae]
MKNIFFCLIISLIFLGCSNPVFTSYLSTSNPIFITENIKGKSFSISSQNFSENFENNLSSALIQNGYKKATKNPDIAIKITLNYLRQNSDIKNNNFMEFGFGSGGFRHVGFGSGFGGGYENEYFYDAQASLLIALKDSNNYQTNLNLQSQKSSFEHSQTQAMDSFELKIISKIIEILNGF